VLDGELAVTAWLHSTWSDAPHMLALLCFHVALISYWAKDCFATPMNQLTMAHHVVSILATVASMIEWLPHAAALFAFGAFTLECGSLVNSVCELFPGLLLRVVMTPLMSASNALAVALVLWYAAAFGEFGGDIARWIAAVVGVALALMRQKEWHKRVAADCAARERADAGHATPYLAAPTMP